MNMTYPNLWLNHWRTRRALVGYPLYDVPYKQEERKLKEAQFQTNFDYFMRVRFERLAFFQSWLEGHFNVSAPVNGDGLRAVNAWINAFGAPLIGDGVDAMRIFGSYQPVWEGKYAGYNVVYDIAIFIGEYLISKRPKLHWQLYRGPKAGSGETSGANMYRPYIRGFPRYWDKDAVGTAFAAVRQARRSSMIGHYPLESSPHLMMRDCQTSLVLANVPDDDQPFIFGDYSNEPL